MLINHNFFLAVTMLSKSLFAHEENPFEAMFSQMLVDQIVTHDRKSKFIVIITLVVVGGRCPKMGEETLDVLSEEAIRVYLMYYDQLK